MAKKLLREAQWSLAGCALFAAALAAAFMGRDNRVMTELCQTALFLMVLSGACNVIRTNI